MSASHHSDGRSERELAKLRERFLQQVDGNSKREWSQGRMGAEDDGDLSYALATDTKRGVIVMRFGKPVEWLGFGIKEAEQLRDELTDRLMELRGVAP